MLRKLRLPERLTDTPAWIKNFLQVAKPWAHKHEQPWATRAELFPTPVVITPTGYDAWYTYTNSILDDNAAIYAIMRDHWDLHADGTHGTALGLSHYKYEGSAAAPAKINAYGGVAADLPAHTHPGEHVGLGVGQFLVPLNTDNQQFEYYMATAASIAGTLDVEMWLDGYVREINV